MIIVSACLAWINCRYDWNSRSIQKIIDLVKNWEAVPVCPELLWWLATPRPKSEIRWDKVVTENWDDVTEQFVYWATEWLKIAKEKFCRLAILKSKSPSCWCWLIYDGNFLWRLKKWDWIYTKLLKESWIEVRTENNLPENLL